MKIAYFTNTYPRATDTFIRREVIGLRNRGFSVDTYSVRKTDSSHDVSDEVISEKNSTKYLLPANFLAVIFLNFKLLITGPGKYFSTLSLALKTARPGVKGHLLQVAYFLEATLLAEMLKKDKIEHLHNHLGDNSGNVTLLASRLTGIPFSISIHGPHIFFDALYWALYEKTKYAKFISCIGHYCKSQMMLYTDPEDWHKFKIVRCGINIEEFKLADPVENQIKKLVFVGRLSPEKGIRILFDSLAILKDRGLDCQLTLLGDGPDREVLTRLSSDLDLDDRILFKGFVNQAEITETLSESDIFVLPSFAEGIPVSLMEAMAIGKPVIASYVGGVTELVVEGETGLVVYPSDAVSLADSIATYLNDEELRNKIIQSARQKVEQEFNIEHQIDKLAVLFRE